VREPHLPLLCLLPELDDHAHDVGAVGLAVDRVGVELLLGRADLGVHEVADPLAGRLDVGRQREVDAHGTSVPVP
jgi:hypothetical protein